MTRSKKTAIWAIVATMSSAIWCTGCGMNRRYANNLIRQLPHTNVAIEYGWVNTGNSEIQQSALPIGEPGKQLLSITYPHPSPKYGRKYAEVTLRREADATNAAVANAVSQLVTNPFKKQEATATGSDEHVLRLTIPREELEFLLRDLVADSYFDHEDRSGDVNLGVTLGSRSTHKLWDHIESFDQLARRVTEENGQRSGHPRGGKVMPASAQLLPPTPNEPLDDSTAEPKRKGRMHSVPQF